MSYRAILNCLFLTAPISPFALGGDQDFELETQLIRLPAPLALKIVYGEERVGSGDVILERALEAVARGRGKVLDRGNLKGMRKTVRDETKSYSFPAEYDLKGEGRRAKLVSAVDEHRKFGTVVAAIVGVSGDGTAQVSLDFEYHLGAPVERPVQYPEGKKSIELKVSQPEFRHHKLSSRYTAIPGKADLVAMVSPARIDAPQNAAFVDLLFARVAGKPPEEPIDYPSSDIGFLTFSVPDALGAKVEAQGKSASELLGQLITAVSRGKAYLEAVAHNHRSLRPQCDAPVSGVLECRLPKAIHPSKGKSPAVPGNIQPIPLGIAAAAYVDRRRAGDRVPWRLTVDLERPRPVRDGDATKISYEGAQLKLGGILDLRGDEAIKLVDVRTETVREARRYFTFLRVETK